MKLLKRLFLATAVLIIVISLIYLAGPKYPFEDFDAVPIVSNISYTDVDSILIEKEKNYTIKPDNEARVIWHNGVQKSEYGILYLHGWSASQGEGDPMHRDLAKRYGANLILSRLPGHGVIGEELLLDITAREIIEYTKEIIDIASKTCDKLIILSCSTGSTLSAYLSSEDPRIYAQIMTSPNFGIADPTFDRLDQQWGLQIVRKIYKSKNNIWVPNNPEMKKYWHTTYRLEGLVVLDQIVSHSMNNEVFKKITTPIYIGYYYESEDKQDDVIDVSLIKPFLENVSSDPSLLYSKAFTGRLYHVIASPLTNRHYQDIQKSIEHFFEQVLDISVIDTHASRD